MMRVSTFRVQVQASPWLRTKRCRTAESGHGAVGRDVLDDAERRGRVHEMRRVGQEAPDLDLGVGAWLKATVDLESHAIVEVDRRVRLFGAHAADRVGVDRLFVRQQGRGGVKRILPPLRVSISSPRRRECSTALANSGEASASSSRPMRAPRRNRAMAKGISVSSSSSGLAEDGDRHEVALLGLADRHAEQGHQVAPVGAFAQHGEIFGVDLGHVLALGGEPASGLEIRRPDAGLKRPAARDR